MDLSTFSPSSALLTVLFVALAPFVAVMVTSFTKIVVVLSLVRNAVGVQQVPPNLVLNGLALILTLYVMYPVADAMRTEIHRSVGDAHPMADSASLLHALNAGKEPLRRFLLAHAEEREREFFVRTARRMLPDERAAQIHASDFIVIVPAFTVSELTAAFQIGFLLFLPFIVIDLVIANILMAMGMMMLSPTIVSMPFKLLLFVLIEGWTRLVHGLVLSYT